MTWDDLLALLLDMKNSNHSAFTEYARVAVMFNDGRYHVDLNESLTTGDLILVPAFSEDDDG